jgi:hypothetical protein
VTTTTSATTAPPPPPDQGFLAGCLVTIAIDMTGAAAPVVEHDGRRYVLRPVDAIAAGKARRKRPAPEPDGLTVSSGSPIDIWHQTRVAACALVKAPRCRPGRSFVPPVLPGERRVTPNLGPSRSIDFRHRPPFW